MRVLMAWSGGKDSTLALQAALRDPGLDVVGLLTTITDEYDRISMHGVRTTLLRDQCAALGLPLVEVRIPPAASNATYQGAMRRALERAMTEQGVSGTVFGDLFLRDIREYRERMNAELGLQSVFPLWLDDTQALGRRFIAEGFRALLVCVDPKQIDPSFCGREYDEALLADLPGSADPCGENGEFHTFVYDGPIFRSRVPVARGEIVERGGFWFCDLL